MIANNSLRLAGYGHAFACVVLLCVAGVVGAAAGDNEDGSERIKKIEKERLENATKLFDFVKERYLPGGGFKIPPPEATVEQVIHARAELLKLQLAQSTTKAERIKAYQKAVQDISVLEMRAVARLEKAKRVQYDVLRLAGYHLELEYALEREKLGKKAPASMD